MCNIHVRPHILYVWYSIYCFVFLYSSDISICPKLFTCKMVCTSWKNDWLMFLGISVLKKKNWYIVTCFWEQNDMKTIKMSKFELSINVNLLVAWRERRFKLAFILFLSLPKCISYENFPRKYVALCCWLRLSTKLCICNENYSKISSTLPFASGFIINANCNQPTNQS